MKEGGTGVGNLLIGLTCTVQEDRRPRSRGEALIVGKAPIIDTSVTGYR